MRPRGLLLAALVTCGASSALARGTAYRGPETEVPEVHREASDPPRRSHPTGCTCSPADGPELAPPSEAELRARREADARVHKLHFDDWAFWWNRARDEFLVPPPRPAPPREWVEGAVVPLLRARLADSDEHFDVRAAAALALGRLDDQESVPLLLAVVRDDDPRGSDRVAREGAQLALGLLGAEGVALDELRSRLTRTTLRREFVRPYAAVALGLAASRRGTPDAVRGLLATTLAERSRERGLGPACALALAELGGVSARRRLTVAVDLGTEGPEGERGLPETTVAWAATSLGRLAERGTPDDRVAAGSVLRARVLQSDRPTPRNVRRAAVQATGRLVGGVDPEFAGLLVDALVQAATEDEDRTVRRFARLALARAAGALPSGELHAQILEVLLAVPADGTTALALGVAGRSGLPGGVRTRVLDRLSAWRAAGQDDRLRAAAALGAALLGDTGVAEDAAAWVGGEDVLEGYGVQALALLEGPAPESLTKAAERPELLDHRALVALGVFQSGIDPLPLVRILADDPLLRDWTDHQHAVGGAARALADLRDPTALRAVLRLVEPDPEDPRPPILRAAAIWTLGRACATEGGPRWPALGLDSNHRAHADAIDELVHLE